MTDPVTVEPLKPCPFCGTDKVRIHGPYGWYREWCISHSCSSFYSGTSEFAKGFRSEADAIAAWNTRAIPSREPGTKNLDWLKIAKLAGKHGVRYQTNSRMEAFLTDLQRLGQEFDASPSREPGELERVEAAIAKEWNRLKACGPRELAVAAIAALTLPEQPRPVDDVERLRERLNEAIKALSPFARHVGKRGEIIKLSWGHDNWTATLAPEDFYLAAEVVRQDNKTERS